ncbi:hypothetical protein EKI60_03430 [Candidatus Saccharibacteria bacterium]|nr:MAG: hypothetical protein EKI60_03430 [Candidatus Saccharibacteria bacterium]
MRKLDQRGVADTWLIAFIVTLIAFLGTAGFGLWAFAGRQDYKNNVDDKIAEAVAAAEQTLSEKKAVEFAEKEKNPLKTYTGPAAFGSVTISYPKTWSAYVDEANGSTPVNGFLNPSFVPTATDSQKHNLALRFQVSNSSYTTTVRNLESQVKSGKIKTVPYTAPKVPGTVGVRVEGQVATGKQGAMVILPVRDKVLKVWTESPQYIGDLNDIILANFTFVP